MNCLRLVWRVSMIYGSKVILFATLGNISMSQLPQGVPLWNHGNYLLATLKFMLHLTQVWNCSLPNWTLVIWFSPSLSMCVLCLSSRDVPMSHSRSWSWAARSLRRSFPVEFPSVIIVLDEDLEIKDVKINEMQCIGIFEKGSWIKKTVIVLWPLCLLTSHLECRDEILV